MNELAVKMNPILRKTLQVKGKLVSFSNVQAPAQAIAILPQAIRLK